MSQQNDVWDSANDTTMGPKKYFGQLATDAFFVYISKGAQKVPFDPQAHPLHKRFTQMKIDGLCSKADGSTYTIAREIICEFGREWAGIVLPSLKKLGIHPRDLNDRWASWERVPTGRKWQNDAGETVDTLTFKFTQFFDSEEACRQAEAKFYNRAPVEPEPDLDDTMPMPEDTPADSGPTRADAAGFLDQFLILAGQDLDAFYASIVSSPVLSKYFGETVEEIASCPEVVLAIGRAA